MAGSSLSRNRESEKYEVFISFSGDDVRRGFLSHFYPALKAEQIHAFIDNDLERGKDITRNLFRIIEQSNMSVVVFSQNYPKSEWCLEELEKIHESMKQRKQIVVPVFYQVDPSDVQHLQGNYAVLLQKWRDALVEISNLSGFVSENFENDAILIQDIVAAVSMKLTEICPNLSREEGLFGIDSSIDDVESLLHLNSINDAKMVGIWGMGGIGKTTIASKVFDKIKKRFRGHCFLPNVRETLSSRNGLIILRDKMICDLLGNKDVKIDSPFLVDASISRRLKRIEVLLVLDDVHTCVQLKSLLESSGLNSQHSFCPGSRIIVTSRDSQVLRYVKLKSAIYEAKQLKEDEAVQLLCWHAFCQNKPRQGYEKISKEVVRYADGVPLALVVLGSELKDKPVGYWEAALKKVISFSPSGIQKILRVSFDGLDREEKNIFLDIACFFKGQFTYYVKHVLESLGYHAGIGIERLIDKSLLRVEKLYGGEIITMHDLVQQMGLEIIAEEKERQGQQSRLWEFDDIKDALTNERGTKNVEAIMFENTMSPSFFSGEININSEAFIHMHKLRFLCLEDVCIRCPKGLEFLPNNIKILRWIYYPLNYLPSNYNAHKLVLLEMQYSQLVEINLSKPLRNLKLIDLSYSEILMKIADLAMAPNLQTLMLVGCKRLVEVGASLENLNKLTSLDVSYCISLCRLPELPCSITELKLEGSGLRRLPSKIGRLTLLKHLSLIDCERLESLPSSICSLSSLEKISLSGCFNLRQLIEDFGNLKANNASPSGLMKLPQSIQNLHNLRSLDLTGCKKLQALPALPSNLESFFASSCLSLLNEVSSSIADQYFWNTHNKLRKAYRLCVDGSQLPWWMMYRNECGTSISLELETDGHSIGFIFCVVCSPKPYGFSLFTEVAATLRFDEISETEHHFYDVEEVRRNRYDCWEEAPEVMFVWTCNLDCRSVNKVSFKVLNSSLRKITKCGVCPVSYTEFSRKRKQPDNGGVDRHL